MPRLNSVAEALMGVAGTPNSIDGVPVPHPLLQCRWLRDRVVIGAKAIEIGGGVFSWDRDGGALMMLDSRPASDLIAGGGRWCGWSPGIGVFGSLGDHPAAGLRGGSPKALAIVADYNTGYGFVTMGDDGSGLINSTALAQDLQCPRADQVYWWDLAARSIVRTPLVPPLITALPPRILRWVRWGTEDWVIYFSEGIGAVAQKSGSKSGWLLETADTWGLDAVATPGGITVAWSTTAGEGPGDLVKVLVITDAAIGIWGNPQHIRHVDDLAALAQPIPPEPTPEPPDPLPEPPDPVPPPPDYATLFPYTGAHMITKQIGLIGPGGKFARLDGSEFGHGPFGAYPVHWDRDSVGPDETFILTERPDGKFTIQHNVVRTYFGADSTEYAADICGQYTTHATAPGAYEIWTVKRVQPGGTIIAFIEYDRPGHPRYTSQSLTVIEQ